MKFILYMPGFGPQHHVTNTGRAALSITPGLGRETGGSLGLDGQPVRPNQ